MNKKILENKINLTFFTFFFSTLKNNYIKKIILKINIDRIDTVTQKVQIKNKKL